MNIYGIARKSTKQDANIAAQKDSVVQFAGEDVAKWLVGEGRQGSSARWHDALRAFVTDAIEAGADRVVTALGRDRLVRDNAVQNEIVDALDAAGIDFFTSYGERITNLSSDGWKRNQDEGVMHEWLSRRTRERVALNKARRVENGQTVGRLPRLGVRSVDGKVEVVEGERDAVVTAWTMFANGETSVDIQAALAGAGHALTLPQIQTMLGDRAGEIYRGNIVFGDLRNEGAHEAIVSEGLWRRAQATKGKRARGKRPSSDRLLARLGVLRCPHCQARFVVGNGGRPGAKTPTYRHPPNAENCDYRVSIDAKIAERVLLHETAKALRGVHGASGGAVAPAQTALDDAEARLAKLRRIALLADDESGMADEIREAKARVTERRADLDDVRIHAGVTWSVGTVLDADGNAVPDFEGMGHDDLRSLIATVVETATVGPKVNGQSPQDRISVTIRETFDVSRTLDSAAADLAEVVAISEREDVTNRRIRISA